MKKLIFVVSLMLVTVQVWGAPAPLPKVDPVDNTLNAAAFRSFTTAKTDPLAVGRTIKVAWPMTVNTATVSSGVMIVGQGALNVAAGKILTLKGPFTAPYAQVFTGAGTVTGLTEARPEWWGAAGDGVTDDTAAMQKADTVAAASRGTLWLSAKSYVVNGLVLSSYSHIRGVGWGSKLLHTSGAYCMTGSGGKQFGKLSDFTISGAGNASAVAGIHLDGYHRWVIDHVSVSGYTATGVGLGSLGASAVEITQSWIGTIGNGCNLSGNTVGVNLYGGAGGDNALNIVNSIFETNSAYHIYLTAANQILVQGNTIESAATNNYGVYINTGRAIDVLSNYFESIDVTSVHCQSSAYIEGVNIKGNRFSSTSGLYDIDVVGGMGVSIEGNTFSSTGVTANIHTAGIGYARGLNIGTNTPPNPAVVPWFLADALPSAASKIWAPTNYIWNSVVFENSWVDYGTSQPATSYKLNDDGTVSVRGVVKSGAAGTTVFTLPVGFRPLKQEMFSCTGDSTAMNRVTVNADGTVKVAVIGTAGTYVSLSGIKFSIYN